jgi:hypothetical protein
LNALNTKNIAILEGIQVSGIGWASAIALVAIFGALMFNYGAEDLTRLKLVIEREREVVGNISLQRHS